MRARPDGLTVPATVVELLDQQPLHRRGVEAPIWVTERPREQDQHAGDASLRTSGRLDEGEAISDAAAAVPQSATHPWMACGLPLGSPSQCSKSRVCGVEVHLGPYMDSARGLSPAPAMPTVACPTLDSRHTSFVRDGLRRRARQVAHSLPPHSRVPSSSQALTPERVSWRIADDKRFMPERSRQRRSGEGSSAVVLAVRAGGRPAARSEERYGREVASR